MAQVEAFARLVADADDAAVTVSNSPSLSPVAATVTTAHITHGHHRQRHRQALVALLQLLQSLLNRHYSASVLETADSIQKAPVASKKMAGADGLLSQYLNDLSVFTRSD